MGFVVLILEIGVKLVKIIFFDGIIIEFVVDVWDYLGLFLFNFNGKVLIFCFGGNDNFNLVVLIGSLNID